MVENPTDAASTNGPPAIRAPRQPSASRGWRETAALFTLLTTQEARLLALVMGLLCLGLSVRFVHLRREYSRILPAETKAAQPDRSPSP